MAELTVAGWVVSPLTKKLAEKALSYAGDQYKWFKGPANSLNHLASSLTRIQAASRSVERQQTQDTHHQAWLQQLRDAIYEIEDLLDEFSYLALKSGIQPKLSRYLSNSGRTVKRIFGIDKPITKLKSLLLKLDAIEESYKSLVGVATLEALRSVDPLADAADSSVPLVGSVPAEDVMIGRVVEYQGLLSRLIDSPGPSRGDSSIPVIAVVGAAGMGKTTIAQFAFNDPAVEERFEMMMWVTVPEKFDEADLTREIINSAENDVCAGALNFGGLQQVLKRMVKSKKFLLVLDNVWHEDNERAHVEERWRNVFAPLRFADRSASRILVTTRMLSVPKILGSTDPLFLNRLTDSDEWSILKKFSLGDETSKDCKDLENIGRQIATKLDGSPFDAKVVGGMLREKLTREFWKQILSNKDMYNNSISTVKSSFAKLPEQLQRCFAYCSIFPRNWRFDRKKLVNMWIAHDFIDPPEGQQKGLEELGFEYFNELKRKSFFESLNPGRRRTYYVIHDTVYDAALSASTTECMRVEGSQPNHVPHSVVHLSVSISSLPELQNQCELKRLRTLLVLKSHSHPLEKIDEALLKELTSLRVLDLSDSDITNLSENVGRMIHLRYLALCRTLNVLPQSVVDLLHLQTLYIPRECKIEKLPDGFNKLINMRHLDVDPKCIAEISCIGGMVKLSCSIEFHVKKDDGHKLEELENVDDINGKLTIRNLENVANGQESGKANLKKKKLVKFLNLEWSAGARHWPSVVEVEVLENLEPHPNLQELHIMRYRGDKSPQWLEKGVLSNLKKIYLINCRRWKVLPPLGHLPALRILHVKEMDSVERVGQEFYGTDEEAFPNLQELEFDDMPQLTEWSPCVHSLSFPMLKKVKISNCPKLVNIRPVPAAVTVMEAKRNGFVSYLKMRPYHSSEPEKLFLETSSLTILENLLCGDLTKYIQVLIVCQCKELVKTTAGYKALANVERLRICQSELIDDELKILLQEMKTLETLEIIDCPNIETLQLAGERNVLEELRVENCKMLSSLVPLQSSPSLQILIIERCPKFTVASLPSNLKTLLSLKKFSVQHCPGFQSLPTDGLPQSLEWFELIGCDHNLIKSLHERKGSDWKKIAHVFSVLIHY